ncbi:MAG: hypothetical protein JWN41_147, partial [Thermoleophilia bacterium]|nr:hypothetical protein [Thermoleophilia bacterium]
VLLKLAGVNRHTRAGSAEARDMLQAQSVQREPGRLADAIIGAPHLDPKLREPLRLAIRSITDSKESDPIAVLTKRFGITV